MAIRGSNEFYDLATTETCSNGHPRIGFACLPDSPLGGTFFIKSNCYV